MLWGTGPLLDPAACCSCSANVPYDVLHDHALFSGDTRCVRSVPALPDPLPSSCLELRELCGLPISALPSPDALLRLTALRTLSLVGPLDRALGPLAGLRCRHTNSMDDGQARPLSEAVAEYILSELAPDPVKAHLLSDLCTCLRMHNAVGHAMQ